MSEWKETKLGEYITHKKGFAFKSKDLGENGHCVIKVKDFTEYSIDISKCQFLNEALANDFDDYKLATNDVVISTVGSWPSNPASIVGKVVKVPKVANDCLLNQNAVRLRSNEKMLQNYLYYRLRTQEFSDYLISGAQGSANQASITLNDIFNYTFQLPPLEEQKAIAETLSSLDDKIDLLHQQNITLEQMAQILFRQWFIEEAKNEWEEYSISDFTAHKKVSIKPAQNPSEEFLHFSLPAFDKNKEPNVELGLDIKSNKYQVEPFSILMSKLNPKTPRVWDIYFEPEVNSICSTEFQVLQPKDKELFPFLSTLLKSDKVTGDLSMSASGTSGSHQRVKPEDMLNINFFTPSVEKMKEFSKLLEPNFLKKTQNQQQIKTLENIRDTLLPKLMSGEVRVKL